MEGTGEPIPWSFTDSPGVLMWMWATEHFVARIQGTEVSVESESLGGLPGGRRLVRSYLWNLSDRVRLQQGVPRLLIEGNSSTFDQAENLIREHIGKCYDRTLGYRRFAGSHTFTFQLSTGENVDVSSLIGTQCTVTVLIAGGARRTVIGDLDVIGYRWLVTSADGSFEIVPEHVVAITNRSAIAEQARAVVHIETYSGVGRMYREDPRAGCTGRAGFMQGTVDHAGAGRCPLHEVGIPDHLLN
jgi:hypothetical protein